MKLMLGYRLRRWMLFMCRPVLRRGRESLRCLTLLLKKYIIVNRPRGGEPTVGRDSILSISVITRQPKSVVDFII